MVTLQIEHAITDIDVWRAAFDRFAPARARAGVLRHRIAVPVADRTCVVVELDFAELGQAEAFLGFLRETVWASPSDAPALIGIPQTRFLAVVDHG